MPSSTSSSGYWSWSAPSDQSNPSTPSPPLSADSFKPFRLPSQTDDGFDETETSSLLFDEPIPRKRKVSIYQVLYSTTFEVLFNQTKNQTALFSLVYAVLFLNIGHTFIAFGVIEFTMWRYSLMLQC